MKNMLILFVAFSLVPCFFVQGASAQVSADFSGGAMIVGEASDACVPDIIGALRWNSAGKAMESCDGGSWKRLVTTPEFPPSVSSPPPGMGYFVLSAGTWDGNLGRRPGADEKCLADLIANDWMGKADAVTRDLLIEQKVRAFLCDGSGVYNCNHALPGVTYAFAASGAPAVGGTTFTADIDRLGPGDSNNWSGGGYFGSAVRYWTHRGSNTATLWGNSGSTSAAANNCNGFTTNASDGVAGTGISNSTGGTRWISTQRACDNSYYLVCMVHP